MLTVGDRVRLTKHPQTPEGKIHSLDWLGDMITVEWDEDLIPKMQEYPRYMFFDGSFEMLGEKIKSFCECGSKYDRDMPQVHSYWCPAHKETV